MTGPPPAPLTVSVVVGLISGDPCDLSRCLAALHNQTRPPREILVPYDDPCAAITALAAGFPRVRFIHADGLDTHAARRGASREHHDDLRTIGLRAATGDVVVLTEDHAVAPPTWCEELVRALTRFPDAAAVGGAVECGSSRLLNRAVWLCDFGRYQNPLPEGPAAFVSDSNVAYRAAALRSVAPAWQDAYHETVVHEALARAGFALMTTPRVIVWQARSGLTLPRALRERFVWARSFAGTRARSLSRAGRLTLAALSPLLPLVLSSRLCIVSARRARRLTPLIAALPAVLLLQTAWAAGECVGYVTAVAGPRS